MHHTILASSGRLVVSTQSFGNSNSKMTNFRFLILICFISEHQCSPLEDSDVVEIITGEQNGIDNIDHHINIDIGHLGSEAYGMPKDDSGKRSVIIIF